MEQKYINFRISDEMKSELNEVFDSEGIDWTSLSKAKIYDFVLSVESNKEPQLEDPSYLDVDKNNKNKQLQILLSGTLKDRFDNAIKKFNEENSTKINKTLVVLPYLLSLMKLSQEKQVK
ncbi:hypothetical protein [Shimazuella kribbensis]|uniref:hypothetical protein n=1 Tax=Shimazuella kribbensis TaxID=139808 RepID=UPI00048D0AE8|nr:hypothetical protein [Shimazuella kribbensis]